LLEPMPSRECRSPQSHEAPPAAAAAAPTLSRPSAGLLDATERYTLARVICPHIILHLGVKHVEASRAKVLLVVSDVLLVLQGARARIDGLISSTRGKKSGPPPAALTVARVL
jgi:hypothetical protein